MYCHPLQNSVFPRSKHPLFFCALVLPISPSILNSKKVVRNSSWVLRWSEVYSEGSPVMLYTVYYSLQVITNNVTRDGPWKSNNVTGFMYTTHLEARTRYVFAVTAWNRWGESLLENDKMLYIYTDFMDGITIQTGKTSVIFETGEVCSFIYYILTISLYRFP